MFDRPEERSPRNTGRVSTRTENPVLEGSNNKTLYVIIGILGIILMIGGGVFIFNLGKKSNSKPYSNSESEIILAENTDTSSTKIESIPFQELVGEYIGNINNQTITVKIFSEGNKKKYSYSKNNRLSYMLFHFPATNDINFHRPKEDLAEFRAFKEGNTIILRSTKVELRKIN